MKTATVNVLEVINHVPQQIFSFKDDKKGNKEAEAIFTKMCKENGASDRNMNSYLEDGFFDYDDCGIYLIHSS